jgi:hypothetical protein
LHVLTGDLGDWHHKRESPHDVTGCKTPRIRLRPKLGCTTAEWHLRSLIWSFRKGVVYHLGGAALYTT